MARTSLITGAANSGKARWAISYFAHCDDVVYITSNCFMDDETKKRMDYSNEHNGVQWTVKRHDGAPADAIDEEHRYFIFDGLPEYVISLLEITRDIDIVTPEKAAAVKSKVITEVQQMIEKVSEVDANLIIITLEPGFSVNPIPPGQKAFRDILCAVNQRIANVADEVYLSVSGIQMQIK